METFFHPDQLLHHPRSYLSRGEMREAQEVPQRAIRLLAGVRKLGLEPIAPPNRGIKPILAVHDIGYLRFLESAHRQWKKMPADWGDEVISNVYVREGNARRGILAEAGFHLADGSCPVGEFTWRSAYWSAQTALAGAHSIIEANPLAYALCRPPGHHARVDAAGGFCYLNNSAIAAQALRERFERVLILDTDMHHGQGVQEIFYARNDVFYVSIHGDPVNFYPAVCGFPEERGTGAGAGYNLNLPMPHGSEEGVFFDRLDEALCAARGFAPDVVVLALGFDVYKDDPQARVAVESEGFERLGSAVKSLGLPVLVVQEGGYDIATLDQNLKRFFDGITQ